MQYQEGEWHLQQRVRSVENQNEEYVKEVRKPITAWFTMHKFQTVARKLEDFQPCCTKYEQKNPRLSRIPTCIIKSKEGKLVKVLSGTTYKTITFEENVDVEKIKRNMSDVELNKDLIKEFEIFLNNPPKFNLIMQELEKSNKIVTTS